MNGPPRNKNTTLIGVPINEQMVVTHILYHILPLGGESEHIWKKHIKWLKEVRPQFNGRFIVGVMTQGTGDSYLPSLMPVSAVRNELRGIDVEIITSPNHKRVGEGMTFPKMLEMIKSKDPDQVFFYGHCKGVTRPNDEIPHKWAEAMFDTVFRNRRAVIEALNTSGITGSFRTTGGRPIGRAGVGPWWFFSGTFFAARSVDVFSRNWKHIPNYYGCVEQWPRLNFTRDKETSCLFFDRSDNLYDGEYWKNHVTPALEDWREKRKTAVHSGDYGDIIYHLPVMKEMGIKRLVLSPVIKTREWMTEDRANGIITLLKKVDFLDDVRWEESPPEGAIRFDKWRAFLSPSRDNETLMNLAADYWLGRGVDDSAWLDVEPVSVAKVVISRSLRYLSEDFPWKDVVDSFSSSAVFVGTKEEHERFCELFGNVRFHQCDDLLELAHVISGCDLFIGNQSCPRAIAESLKKPVIVEECCPTANTRFIRSNAWYGADECRQAVDLFKKREGQKTIVDLDAGPNFQGSGDGVLLAWIAAGEMGNMQIATSDEKAWLLKLIDVPVIERTDGINPSPIFDLEVNSRGSEPRIQAAARFLGAVGNPRRPKMTIPKKAKEIAEKFWDGVQEKVLLCPEVNDRSREWDKWDELAKKLTSPKILHKSLARSLSYNQDDSWATVCAIVEKSDLIVGCDSAYMHIAATLNKKGVVLLGPTKSTVFSHADCIKCVSVPRRDALCAGCCFGFPFGERCKSKGCSELQKIQVEDVLEKITESLYLRPESCPSTT